MLTPSGGRTGAGTAVGVLGVEPDTREAAEARRDGLNAARHTSALAEARKAGDLPSGYCAWAWLDSFQMKVKQGRLKQNALDSDEENLQRYTLKMVSARAIAAIAPHDCEDSLASCVRQQSRQGADGVLGNMLSPATVKHGCGTFRRRRTGRQGTRRR